MNIQNLTTSNYIVLGSTLALVIWVVITTIKATIRGDKIIDLKKDIRILKEEINSLESLNRAFKGKINNRIEQCDRLTGEKLTLQEKNRILTERNALLETKETTKVKEAFNKHMPPKPIDSKSNARKGASSPSRKKEADSGSNSKA